MNTKPPPEARKLRYFARRAWLDLIHAVNSLNDDGNRNSIAVTCISCDHFNEGMEQCNKVVPAQRPPARVIAFGCQAWENIDDDIPF